MSELKPCPFCGGEAERIDIEAGENAGGSCVCCTECLASSNVEFEFKENFVSNWNRRASDDTIADLVKALEPFSAMAGVMFARNWNASDVALEVFPTDVLQNGCRLTAGNFFSARAALLKARGETR